MAIKKQQHRPINFIIPLHVYPFDVMVSIGQSDDELADSLAPFDNRNMREGDYELCKYSSETCHGLAVMFSTNATLIRLRNLPHTPDQFGWVAHEVFHAATFILDRIGMRLEVMVSDEAYAYLIQYLTTEIYKNTNKYYK